MKTTVEEVKFKIQQAKKQAETVLVAHRYSTTTAAYLQAASVVALADDLINFINAPQPIPQSMH